MTHLKKALFLIAFLYSNATFAMYGDDLKDEQGSKTPAQQLPKDLTESNEGESFGVRYNKSQIQPNPPLWLHIEVDKRSLYSAYANAWVTLGSDKTAKRYAVSTLTLSLSFEKTTEETQTNSSSIEVSQRTSDKCYNQASATARTAGPNGSVYAATN